MKKKYSATKNDSVFEIDTEYAKFLSESLSNAEFKGAGLTVGIAKGQAEVNVNERRSFREKGKFKGDGDFRKGKGAPDFKKGKGGSDFKKEKGDVDFKKNKEFPENKDEEIKSWIKSKGENPFSGSDECAGKKKKKKK